MTAHAEGTGTRTIRGSSPHRRGLRSSRRGATPGLRPAGAGRPGRHDPAALPAPLHRRPARHAEGARDWMPLGNADEQKPAAEGTVEAWGRSPDNPVGGWYGLKKGLRGRFGNYVPPVLEALGLAEVEHNARNNRMRASDGRRRQPRARQRRCVRRVSRRPSAAPSPARTAAGPASPAGRRPGGGRPTPPGSRPAPRP